MHLLLFAQPGLEESAQALNQLKEAFPEATIDVVNASNVMAEIYLCPFIQEEGADIGFYGLSGIETFIRFRKIEIGDKASINEKKRRPRTSGIKPLSVSV